MATRVSLVALEGMTGSCLMAMADLLGVANTISARINGGPPLFSVQMVSVDGEPVTSSNGYAVSVGGSLTQVMPGDVLILPAFMISTRAELAAAIEGWQDIIPWLHSHGPVMELVASNCSGSFLLAEAGLLDGREATTAWWLTDHMTENYPYVQVEGDAVCVQSGNVLTGAASMSFLDVGLAIVEKYAGKHFARLVAKYMMIDSQRSSQAPYAILSLFDSDDELVRRAEQWIRSHLSREFRLEEVAEDVGVSTRTLIRRFQSAVGDTPQAVTQKLRVEKSKTLLETTRLSFTEIVSRCGYADESAFRRLFKRYCQMSPKEYRRRFSTI